MGREAYKGKNYFLFSYIFDLDLRVGWGGGDKGMVPEKADIWTNTGMLNLL